MRILSALRPRFRSRWTQAHRNQKARRSGIVLDMLEDRIALAADGNDTPSGAIQVGTINGSAVRTGNVGSPSDNQDYYRFAIGGSGAVPATITLTGLSADLDIDLRTTSGSVISQSVAGGSNSEQITATLSPGSFLVRVFKGISTARSNYTLTITQNTSSLEPNDTRSQAVNLGTLSSSITRDGTIGLPSTDTQDYYRFVVNGRRTLSYVLRNLSADLDVQLMNSSGSVISESRQGGSSNDSGRIRLLGGTYFLRIFQGSSNVTSNYQFNLSLA